MKQARKNFILGVINECLWGAGFGFIMPATILSLALVDLGRSAFAAGLMAALVFTGFNLPQVFSALALSSRFTDPKAAALLHAPAILGPFIASLGFFFTSPSDPTGKLTALFGGFAVFSIGVGVAVPHWVACVGRCIPKPFRGRYFGTSFFAAGLAGTATGWLASYWILQGGMDWGYALCFMASVPCMIASMMVLARLKPLAPRPTTPPSGALWKAFRLISGKIAEPGPFRMGVILSLLMTFVSGATNLFTVYLRERSGMDLALFQIFTPALPLGGMAGALLLGFWLDHRGVRGAFTGAFVAGFLSLGLVGLWSHWIWPTLAFVLSGFLGAAFPVVTMVMILNLSHHKESTLQVGLFNTLMGPWIFLFPLFAGWLADNAGYSWSYALAAACCLVAFGVLLKAKDLDGKAGGKYR